MYSFSGHIQLKNAYSMYKFIPPMMRSIIKDAQVDKGQLSKYLFDKIREHKRLDNNCISIVPDLHIPEILNGIQLIGHWSGNEFYIKGIYLPNSLVAQVDPQILLAFLASRITAAELNEKITSRQPLSSGSHLELQDFQAWRLECESGHDVPSFDTDAGLFGRASPTSSSSSGSGHSSSKSSPSRTSPPVPVKS